MPTAMPRSSPAGPVGPEGLDWNLLRTFFVVVQEKGLSRAAERLGQRQSTITAALQRLEESLGCQLLIRGSRRFELTRYGELLLREAELMVQGAVRIGERLQGAGRDVTGHVRIQLITDVRYAPLDEALRRLHAAFPAITVEIEVVSGHLGARAVAQQRVPMALCLLTAPVAGLRCRFLMREEFGIYCGASHPLYMRDRIEVADLRDMAQVGFAASRQGGLIEPMLALGASLGIGGPLVGGSGDLNEVVRLVRAGLGLGVLPVESAQPAVADGSLRRLSLPGMALGADLYLVTHPQRVPEPAEARFLDIFEALITADRPVPAPPAAAR